MCMLLHRYTVFVILFALRSIKDIYSIWLNVFLLSPPLNNAHANIIPRFQNASVIYCHEVSCFGALAT